jgi:protein involved in polysaccharide export with SLBB domain
MPSSAWACEARKDMPTKTTACHPAQFECKTMTLHDLAFALLRTTLVTSAAACVAALMLAWLQVDSPRTHRVAWLLVVAQGWLLIPWTYEIETLPPPPPPVVQVVEMPRAFVSMEPTDVTFVAARPPLKKQPSAPFPIAAVSISAWLLGATALALIAAVRYATIVRTLPRGVAPDEPQWQREWCRELRTLSLRSSGPLPSAGRAREGGRGGYTRRKQLFARLLSPRIDFRLTQNLGPLVAFIPWHYLLLAPRPLWTALTSPERTAILRHELAHIRRRDLWKSLAFRILALPQWFNPLVWLAARRFDEAAEWHCDRLASLSPGERAGVRERHKPVPNPTTIANALLRTAELASLKRPPRTLGFLAAVPPYRQSTPNRRTALARRIERLVTPRLKEESLMKRLALPALLALVAAAQLIRIEHVAAQNPPPSKGGARGGIHDAASSLLGANLSQGGGSEIVALVDGQFIRASEVLWQVRNLIEKANAPIPPEHVAEAEQMLMRQLVTGLIDTKLLYADFRRTVPAESLTKIEESLAKPFEAEEIPRLLRMLQLENRLELETTLAHSGTSLHDVQRQFNERSIASEWLRQLMPKSQPATDEQLQAYYRDHEDEHGDVPFAEAQATIRERLEKEQEKILLEATMNKLRAAARTWTIFDGHVPAMGSAESAASGVLNDIIATTVYQSHGREFTPKSPASELQQHDVITVEPSEETQAILDELAAARKAGDYHREVRAYFKLPYIIEPPDILEISIKGEATGRGVNSDAGVTDALKIEKMQCLVAMDGKINLGSLGSISVAGLTAPQARDAIKAHVDGELKDAEVLVNVLRNNSKVFYIITKGGELGDDVVRAPITGNETVIDAIASVGGLGKNHEAKIWIARPAANGEGVERILDVNWSDIATGASTATNYQLLPGDRLFIDQSRTEAPTPRVDAAAGPTAPADPPRPALHAQEMPVAATPTGILLLIRKDDGPHSLELQSTPAVGPSKKVSDVLPGVAADHGLDLAAVRISCFTPDDAAKRPRWGRVHAIVWNQKAQAPTPESNIPLTPGCLVWIDALSPPFHKSAIQANVHLPGTMTPENFGHVRVENFEKIELDEFEPAAIGVSNQRNDFAPLVVPATPALTSAAAIGLEPATSTVRTPTSGPTAGQPHGVALIVQPADGDEFRCDVAAAAGTKLSKLLAMPLYPHAIDYATSTITLVRKGDAARGEVTETFVGWDAAAGCVAAGDDHELQTGDEVVIKTRVAAPLSTWAAMPYHPKPRSPSPYRPTAVTAPAPMPAIPRMAAPPMVAPPTVASAAVPTPPVASPARKPRVHYLITWNDADGRLREWDSTGGLQKSDTVGSFVKHLIERGHLRTLDLAAIDLSTSTVYLKREGMGPNSSKSWVIPWDRATGLPAEGEDRALEPHDLIIIGVNGVMPAREDAVTVAFKLEAGRESAQRIPYKLGLTVSDLIGAIALPNPIDFAKTRMMLFKPDAGSAEPSRGQVLPIIWEAGRPTKETNYAVTPGAQLRIDLTRPPLTANSVVEQPVADGAALRAPMPMPPRPPAGKVVDSPVFSPQPAPMTAPMAAPRPPVPVAEGIAYKFSLLEDTSGDLVEFIGHDESNPGAVHQTAALEPALRVLKKHDLVKTIADPRIISQDGRPAEFNLGVEIPGKDRLFRTATHVKIIGREAPSLTASGPARERPALNVEIEAHADHAGERQTLDAAFQLTPGQSAIARLKAKDGSASPIYLVVTPEWLK